MTTLNDLVATVSGALRDTALLTWTQGEIEDLVNQGIDEVGTLYPREVLEAITITSSKSYALTADFLNIFRVDIYSSAGSYKFRLDHGIGDANSGWETHAGILLIPPSLSFTAGDVMRVFGYARYAQLAASSSTTEMDATAIWGVKVFAVAEAYQNLIADRVKYQQWQVESGNSDVTSIALAQLAQAAARRWERAQLRLRRHRRTG